MPTLLDRFIDRVAVPFVAFCFVLPGLYAWHRYAERENRRRGRRW